MTNAGAQAYTIDANGNLTNDGRYQYTWNTFDQLTGVKGDTDTTYTYDENGRRVYSKVGSIETYYRYDGTSNQVLFEENASGVITKAYTYDTNGHPLTLTYNGATYYYLTNYRGDVLALTDTNGAVVAEYTYDAWGNILTQKDLDNLEDVNLAKENPYRYAGYRYDEETKLYYLMARYYNPDTGVFLSLDPVRGDTMEPITMNGYNYANNNPVMNVDPDGEFAKNLLGRLKYGFRKALELFLGKWKTTRDLGETIITETFNFVLGSIAFVKLANTKNKTLANYIYQVKKLSGNFSNTLIKTAKNKLIKHLGRTAALRILGGVGGVAGYEVLTFSYNLTYYAIQYK